MNKISETNIEDIFFEQYFFNKSQCRYILMGDHSQK